MPDQTLRHAVRYIRKLAGGANTETLPDQELLAHFVSHRDEAAFAALVRRHGSLVLGVCRRVLRNSHDAEDACQATFLILSRKASTIRNGASLSCWLHGVAFNVAGNLKKQAARRKERDGLPAEISQPDTTAEVTWHEVQRLLDEELLRLPERFRLPLMLCYLEGKTRDEAAETLGWSQGTLRGRLERAREMLRSRLERKGVGLSAALLGTLFSQNAGEAALPASVAESTVRTALSAAVSARVAALAGGVTKTMFLTKLKISLGIVLVLGILGAGTVFSARVGFGGNSPASRTVDAPTAAKEKSQTEVEEKKEDEWGAAVEGLQLRLHFAKTKWTANEVIPFALDVRNKGEQTWEVSDDLTFYEVSVSGVWYISAADACSFGPPEKLKPEAEKNNWVSERLNHEWVRRGPNRKPGEPLDLKPGKYTIKVAYRFSEKVRAVSNAVEIEIEGKKNAAAPAKPATARERIVVHPISVVVAPDGGTVAFPGSVGRNHAVKVYDAGTGKEQASLPLSDYMFHFAWSLSPDGKLFAAGGDPGYGAPTTVVWGDIATGKERKRLTNVNVWVTCVAFSPDGKLLAAGGRNLKLWDTDTGKERATLKEENNPPFAPGQHNRFVFTPDGGTLISRSDGGTIRLWDTKTGEQITEWAAPDDELRRGFVLFPDGKTIAAATSIREGDNRIPAVKLWDLTKRKERASFRLVGDVSSMDIAVSPDGKTLATIGFEKGTDGHEGDWIVRLWDTDTCKEDAAFKLGSADAFKRQLLRVTFLPDDRLAKKTKHLGWPIRLTEFEPIDGEAPQKSEAEKKEWGDAVEGLEMRLRLPKDRWWVGEALTFELDLRNVGGKTREVSLIPFWCEIEVDGKWYNGDRLLDYKSRIWTLKPGEQQNKVVSVKVDDLWVHRKPDQKEAEPLKLSQGKHTIRVAYPFKDKVRPVSNFVEINVEEPRKQGEDEVKRLIELIEKHKTYALTVGLKGGGEVQREGDKDSADRLSRVMRNACVGPARGNVYVKFSFKGELEPVTLWTTGLAEDIYVIRYFNFTEKFAKWMEEMAPETEDVQSGERQDRGEKEEKVTPELEPLLTQARAIYNEKRPQMLRRFGWLKVNYPELKDTKELTLRRSGDDKLFVQFDYRERPTATAMFCVEFHRTADGKWRYERICVCEIRIEI
jgi:RNA polymerase sigma factor (sigma-70 family)